MAKSHSGNTGDGHKLSKTSLVKLKKALSGETVETAALGDLAPVIKTMIKAILTIKMTTLC